ncbi:TBC1 domain family member 31 [Dendroctonus ponderosae]|uniref:TBC1 domain family member 31 n=1 Tax=Dendroctonus ponderosae TaxID=77166 RepID=UPI00203521EB|nr:TBC1 domain family member 31 [Dendroctonus ponderosae]
MDFLDVAKHLNEELHKKLFKLKTANSDGLLLSIIQSSNRKSSRFSHSDFQSNGNLLAVANNDAQVYIVDFLLHKCWKLKKLESLVCMRFSEFNDRHILAAKSNGIIELIDIDSGIVEAKLLGHQHPVMCISFANTNACISSSKYEAIIWDLISFSKLQMLCLEKDCILKFVLFVPISNHILVCYKDDVIQIWQNGSFENLKQFQPSNWRNHSIKSLCFTRNGKVMAVSGYVPILALFQLDSWKLLKIVNLPSYIHSVKQIEFIPQNFDGGFNKLLAILAGTGIIYFYNIEDNIIISELKSLCDILSFSSPSGNVQYISCLLCSGQVEIYDTSLLLFKNEVTITEIARDDTKNSIQRPKLKNFSKKLDISEKLQIKNILEIDKLKLIIKEYQEFPEAFRATIWERILRLPNNVQQYNGIINHMTLVAFNQLQQQFPLEDKVSIRCLRHVLNNIGVWCPFFTQVEFLPIFLFPFVKVFHKKPIACFELCCTTIINWCQHWFEYHPLPPVNILAIIDNMLMEHDTVSLQHFAENDIKPITYSWSLLETAFSEVLTKPEWLIFWDHVFINEPGFLLCAVVAFISMNRKQFFLLKTEDEFCNFFHSQRPIEFKKFLKKTYFILNNTSGKNHPRQYLKPFASLTCGIYPAFDEYPKEIIDFQVEHINYLEEQLKETEKLREHVLRQQQKQTEIDTDQKNEEERRKIAVEKACIENIKSYQQKLKTQQEELKKMRRELVNEENAIIRHTENKLKINKHRKNAAAMELLSDGLDMTEKSNEINVSNLKESYKLQQLGLFRKSQLVSKYGNGDSDKSGFTDLLFSAHKDTLLLKQHIEKAQTDLHSPRKADIALTMSALDDLINRIKSEIDVDRFSTNYNSVKENMKVHQLEKETKYLQKEVSQLLNVLNGKRVVEDSSSSSSHQCSNQGTCPNKTVRFSTSKS